MEARISTYEPLDGDALMREIERYLAAVEAFRAEGCEPRWTLDVGVSALREHGVAAVDDEGLSADHGGGR